MFLPDSTCRRLPEAPQSRRKTSFGGANEIMAEARDVSDHGLGPNFSFPPSPPLRLDDSLAPLPAPDFLWLPEQGPGFADEADWMQIANQLPTWVHRRRKRTTRTVHLLPAGASSGCFVCDQEWNRATFMPVCRSVSHASLECKRCCGGWSLSDMDALNRALEMASKRARVAEPSIS